MRLFVAVSLLTLTLAGSECRGDVGVQYAASLEIQNLSAVPGDFVHVPVNAEGFFDVNVYQLQVYHDPAVLQFVEVVNVHPALTNAIHSDTIVEGTGIITLNGFSLSPIHIPGKPQLFQLGFVFCDQMDQCFEQGMNADVAFSQENTYLRFFDNQTYQFIDFDLELSNGLIYPDESHFLFLTSLLIETEECYYATSQIVTSENEGFFVVHDEGSITLAAGEKILLLPGSRVYQNGQLHAFISSDDDPCEQKSIKKLPVDRGVDFSLDESETLTGEKHFFKVFPNPAKGFLTIQEVNATGSSTTYIEMVDLMGNRVLSTTLPPGTEHFLPLNDISAGSYVLLIVQEGKHQLELIIKH